MTNQFSSQYKSTLSSVNSPESPIVLVEISHPLLSDPVRVVNDSDDIVSCGNLYVPCPFKCVLPDDSDGQLPKARLSIDNIGRDLMRWVEDSNGGNGSRVTFKQIMRSRPDLIEFEIDMILQNVTANMREVSAELGYDNLFSKPAISIQYRPNNSPGIF